tara:strand:+ start:725 stop:952 length:228 start_codon:yes stop_codon:yes gene_type:complete
MKKFILLNVTNLSLNFFLLLFLFLGIQNSHIRKKVIFFNLETIQLPLSLIVGTSFIAGSISGNLIFNISRFRKDN